MPLGKYLKKIDESLKGKQPERQGHIFVDGIKRVKSPQERLSFHSEESLPQQEQLSKRELFNNQDFVENVHEENSPQDVLMPISPFAASQTVSETDSELLKIENILAENLEPIFFELSPELQQSFKKKGEETARTIQQMLHETKIQMKKIIGIIREWLLMIPGINRLFVEKEAKIKIDKLFLFTKEKEDEN